jgi:hypothetical protein
MDIASGIVLAESLGGYDFIVDLRHQVGCYHVLTVDWWRWHEWNIKWPVSRAEGTNIKAFGV